VSLGDRSWPKAEVCGPALERREQLSSGRADDSNGMRPIYDLFLLFRVHEPHTGHLNHLQIRCLLPNPSRARVPDWVMFGARFAARAHSAASHYGLDGADSLGDDAKSSQRKIMLIAQDQPTVPKAEADDLCDTVHREI
jgi:hypothetical protein